MKRILLFISFISLSLDIFGQSKFDSLVKDTIILENREMIIEIPYISTVYKEKDSYEEGWFIYYPFIDTSLLFIHYGALVKRPFYREFQFYELKEKIERDSIISYQGFCNNNYFREDYYKQYGISIVCKNIPENYISLFNFIMDNFQVYIKK
ncbi:MAG TPA: hypothetical protein PLF32_08770 [Bacteroidales bacterium]|jgi:hypothetical protein|nr:hypothetical protein [Bacteroidales bacterium]HOF16977.1 hypothetical protein [Bacteroidales bacterium]HOR82730.1 hypothetical protein [Bacteroidales bacterium]HPJ91944.1 hypothetical protein [Bacteroidales bacterium]